MQYVLLRNLMVNFAINLQLNSFINAIKVRNLMELQNILYETNR